jgi:hypothetical protein
MTVGTRSIIWQGGQHDFCLAAVGNILQLEQNCGGSGISAIYGRLAGGQWGINDVREPIRLGLIGAGLTPEAAMKLVKGFSRRESQRPGAERHRCHDHPGGRAGRCAG